MSWIKESREKGKKKGKEIRKKREQVTVAAGRAAAAERRRREQIVTPWFNSLRPLLRELRQNGFKVRFENGKPPDRDRIVVIEKRTRKFIDTFKFTLFLECNRDNVCNIVCKTWCQSTRNNRRVFDSTSETSALNSFLREEITEMILKKEERQEAYKK